MNVSLTPELEKYIQDKVDSGLYSSASEVVRAALRELQKEDDHRDYLRREIQRGVDSAEQHGYRKLDNDLIEVIKQNVKSRTRSQKRKSA